MSSLLEQASCSLPSSSSSSSSLLLFLSAKKRSIIHERPGNKVRAPSQQVHVMGEQGNMNHRFIPGGTRTRGRIFFFQVRYVRISYHFRYILGQIGLGPQWRWKWNPSWDVLSCPTNHSHPIVHFMAILEQGSQLTSSFQVSQEGGIQWLPLPVDTASGSGYKGGSRGTW